MSPQRHKDTVCTLAVSLHYTDGVIVISEVSGFSVLLSLSSVLCDGISTSCLSSLYLSIPLWVATKRSFLFLMISSALIATIWVSGVLEWLRSERLGPQYRTTGKLWKP